MASLGRALEKSFYTPWIPIDPVFGRLAGRDDYEAMVAEIERQVNAERARLEWPAVTLTRAVTEIDGTRLESLAPGPSP